MNDRYDERAIVFLDILGFSSVIKQSINNSDIVKRILGALRYIEEVTIDNREGVLGLEEIGKRITNFSDSIVISYPIEQGSGTLYQLILDLCHIQLDLLDKGFLTRGGVSFGKLYHEGNVVFGPAMNEAYHLESKIAKFPRIIVPETYFQKALENRFEANNEEMEKEFLNQLLKKDKDDCYFIDFFQISEVDDISDIVMLHKKSKENIIRQLQSSNINKDVKKKLKWFKRYLKYVEKKYKLNKY